MSLALFTAKTYFDGRELWIADGTSSGTRMLKSYSAEEVGTGFEFVKSGSSVYVFTIGGSGYAPPASSMSWMPVAC